MSNKVKYPWNYYYPDTNFDPSDTEKTTDFVDNVECGTVNATEDVYAVYTSDERLKNDVHDLTKAQAQALINKLRPVMYRWNALAQKKNPNKDERVNYGLIAQELQKVAPEMVYETKKGYLAIDYIQFISILLAACRDKQ